MEALAQLLYLLLLWIPGERNMGWFCMSVKIWFMQLGPASLLSKQKIKAQCRSLILALLGRQQVGSRLHE